jgi:nicotinamide-nucleotide amidase
MAQESLVAPTLEPRAALLAIGTELTTGQIVNSNAAWISVELQKLGIDVILHLTVPDDPQGMREALDYCASHAPLVFITGGLGPTTDDLTRSIVAEWSQRPLQFNGDSWSRIENRLRGFGIEIAQNNRTQATFPEGSLILPNPSGTADGFRLDLPHPCRLWVLPGPPTEGQAIWHSGAQGESIPDQLLKCIPKTAPETLHTWECLGQSESILGELVEATLQGSNLKTGYRAHRPFVEIKVWVPADKRETKAAYLRALDEALKPWYFAKTENEHLERLFEELKFFDEILILDQASHGQLLQKFKALLKLPEYKTIQDRITWIIESKNESTPLSAVTKSDPVTTLDPLDEELGPRTLELRVAGFSETLEWAVALDGTLPSGLSIHQKKLFSTPWRKPALLERARAASVEVAIQAWADWLSERRLASH